jgi:hypothetical protein
VCECEWETEGRVDVWICECVARRWGRVESATWVLTGPVLIDVGEALGRPVPLEP